MAAPSPRPITSAMIQTSGLLAPRPRPCGSQSVISSAYAMATTPTIDPTDRSMLRETMMSTMPVAMIATTAVCTDSVMKVVGWRNLPPVTSPNPRRMATSANSIPKRRTSISVAAISPRRENGRRPSG